MASVIHPTAIVEKSVELGRDVNVGPFCVLRGKVKIGDGSVLESHACVGGAHGLVTIGKSNHIGQAAILGGPPQDLKYKSEDTELVIGDSNVIREFVTINIGTRTGGGVTRVGSHCLIMAYVHIAHDCQLGHSVIVANASQLAGHVVLEDNVRGGGVCKFAQFVRVGKYAFLGGDSTFNKDVLPFSIAEGRWATMRSTNKIGLERAGFAKEEVDNIHRALKKVIRGNGTKDQAMAEIEQDCVPSANIQYILEFMKNSEKGLAR